MVASTQKRTPAKRTPAKRDPTKQDPARRDARDEPQLVSRIGPFELDWPRSLGYFGGTSLAVAVGLIEPPLGLFIAAVPFLKMLDLPGVSALPRVVGQVLEGVAKPVGGDGQGTVRVVTGEGSDEGPVNSDG
jgi:hypothetical protein